MKQDKLKLICDFDALLESQVPTLSALLELLPTGARHWGLLGGYDDDSVRYWLEYTDEDGEIVSLDIDVPLHIALPESDIEREVLLDYVRTHPQCIDDNMGTFLHEEDSDVPVYPWQ